MRVKKLISTMIAAAVTVAMASVMTVSSTAPDRNRTYNVYNASTRTLVDTYTLNHVSIEQSAATAGVIDEDERVVYANTGIVRIVYGDDADNTFGTGFVVDDHIIATVAHCVGPSNSQTVWADLRIELYTDSGVYERTITPSYVHVPQLYYSDSLQERWNYDYALITVSEDLSDYEHFTFGEVLSTTQNIPLTVSGIPDKINNGADDNINNLIYTHTGNLKRVTTDGYCIHHDADMTEGQSGGPAYVRTTIQYGNEDPFETKTVVGLNVRSVNNTTNSVIRITSELIGFYRQNPEISY